MHSGNYKTVYQEDPSVKVVTVIVLAVLLIVVSIIGAMAAPSCWLATKSSYVGPIAGPTFYQGPVLQGSITCPIGQKYYGGIWFSNSMDQAEDKGDEVDFFAGWVSKVGKIKLDLGVNYYNMTPVRSNRGDYLATYAVVSGGNKLGQWSLHTEYDASTERSIAPSGLLVQAEVWPSKLQTGRFKTGLVVAGHPKGFGVDAELISFVALDVQVPVQKNTYFSIWAEKATGISGGMAKDALVGGLNWVW